MFNTVFGLPLHPLVVHATVVIVPTAALAVLLAALWPRFRAWAGWLPLALSLVGLVLVPISTSFGEYLEGQVTETPLVEAHTHMAEGLLVWVIILVAGAAALYYVRYREARGDTAETADGGSADLPRAIVIAAAVVAMIGVVGTSIQVVRIGHSGAKASWSGTSN